MSSKNMELPKLFKFVQLGALVGSIIFAIIGFYFIITSVGIFDMLGSFFVSPWGEHIFEKTHPNEILTMVLPN